MDTEYQKIVKRLMAKGYSKLKAKRLAQQASTQLAMSRMAMMAAIMLTPLLLICLLAGLLRSAAQ